MNRNYTYTQTCPEGRDSNPSGQVKQNGLDQQYGAIPGWMQRAWDSLHGGRSKRCTCCGRPEMEHDLRLPNRTYQAVHAGVCVAGGKAQEWKVDGEQGRRITLGKAEWGEPPGGTT